MMGWMGTQATPKLQASTRLRTCYAFCAARVLTAVCLPPTGLTTSQHRMKAAVACVSALVLPFPAYTFVATPVVSTRSPTVRHITRTHASPRRCLRSPLMTTHAVDLSTTVGTGDAIPAATVKQEKTPAVPALDRSSLGLHLKIGAKVINL